MDDEIDLKEYLIVIKRQWKIIVLVLIIAIVGAMIKTFKEKPIYEVKTTFMIRSSSGGSGSSSLLSSLSGITGINLPSSSNNMNDLIELVKSRAVAAKVLEDLNLRQRIKGWDNPKVSDLSLISAIQGMLKTPDNSGSLTTLKVVYWDKNLVADIANGYAEALSYYWNQLNYTESRRKREYIESQLPRVEKELDIAKQKLKQVNREMNLFSGSNQQASNQSVGNQQSAVSQMYKTSGGGVAAGLDVAQYAQEYELQNSIYLMLKNQYEQVKLEESKETPPFLVIDKAMKPEFDWQPKIKRNLLIGLAAGLVGGLFMAFLVNYLSKAFK